MDGDHHPSTSGRSEEKAADRRLSTDFSTSRLPSKGDVQPASQHSPASQLHYQVDLNLCPAQDVVVTTFQAAEPPARAQTRRVDFPAHQASSDGESASAAGKQPNPAPITPALLALSSAAGVSSSHASPPNHAASTNSSLRLAGLRESVAPTDLNGNFNQPQQSRSMKVPCLTPADIIPGVSASLPQEAIPRMSSSRAISTAEGPQGLNSFTRRKTATAIASSSACQSKNAAHMHREREMDSVQMTATRMPPLRKASRLDIGAKREGSDLSDECHHKVARSGDDPDSTSGLSASKTAGGKLPLGRGGQAVTDAAPQVSNPLVEVRGPAGSLLHKTRSARQEPNPKHPTDGASPPDPGAWREAQHEQMNTQCEATWLTGTEAAVAEDTSVADEACRLPPGQLCNPLVVMCVMALSRQAAVQAVSSRYPNGVEMPIQDKMCDSLESIPENGYVDPGGELVARVDDRKKMARCLTLEKQLDAARKQIQDLKECGLDPDSRQGVTATPWEKNPRTLSLMEELQGEISRRQVAELAACEARAAAGQLLDKIANAHEEQMSSRKSMLDAEQRFQRERRAWEYDSMDMAARAQQTADEMASVCEALQKGKERIAALEEELASETAVKERAMAFITQRALITSREEERQISGRRTDLWDAIAAGAYSSSRLMPFEHATSLYNNESSRIDHKSYASQVQERESQRSRGASILIPGQLSSPTCSPEYPAHIRE